MKSLTITALVPFYNESGRIGPVLRSLLKSAQIDNIIAVNDGSDDDSLSEAQAVKGVTIIDAPHGGKSAAVKRGLADIKSHYVLMVDADIGAFDVAELDSGLHLLGQPIEQVTLPKRKKKTDHHQGHVDMVLFFKRQSWINNPDQTDFLTGQRVMPTADVHSVFETYKSNGYGLETDINDYMYQLKRGVVWIQTEIQHQTKAEKHGVVAGVKGNVDMMSDLLQAGTLKKIWQWKQVWLEVSPAALE